MQLRESQLRYKFWGAFFITSVHNYVRYRSLNHTVSYEPLKGIGLNEHSSSSLRYNIRIFAGFWRDGSWTQLLNI